ncbi:MAG TPA: glycosyltransferase [Thermodesulfobacteriota bacterium]|nr:glycosyltransferase [Thermodesulfobacteriota bacterium]
MVEKYPFFSIIIPTYNRPAQLTNCLYTLTLLDYPRNCFEVIVVNDGGEKMLEAVVDPFHNKIKRSI